MLRIYNKHRLDSFVSVIAKTKQILFSLMAVNFMLIGTTYADQPVIISLPTAIRMSLLNKELSSVYSAVSSWQSALRTYASNWASYDPSSTLSLSYSRSSTLSDGTLSLTDGNSLGLSWSNSMLIYSMGGTLSLGLGLSATNVLVPDPSADSTTAPSLTLSYSQPLTSASRRTAQLIIDQAERTLKQSRYTLVESIGSIIQSTISTFGSYLNAYNSLQTTKEQLAISKRLFNIAQAKLKAGMISELDVLKLKVELANDESSLWSAENTFTQSEQDLLETLGIIHFENQLFIRDTVYEGKKIQLNSDINIVTMNKTLPEYYQIALVNRFDYLQALDELRTAEESLISAESANDPVLSLSAAYSNTRSGTPWINTVWPYQDYSWSYSAALSLPVFQTSSTRLSIESSQASLESTKYNHLQLEKTIMEEVKNNYNSLKMYERQIASLAVNLTIANEAIRISELRYQNGGITVDDVRSSQTALKSAQESLVSAKVNYMSTLVSFLESTGQLPEFYKELINEFMEKHINKK